jgi:outer membrane receptor for ferrienterochelin and colicins
VVGIAPTTEFGIRVRLRHHNASGCCKRSNRNGLWGTTLASVCVLLLGTTRPALSAEGSVSSNELGELSLQQLIDIPVYAASRREQTVSEAPAAVTVITHDDIQKYGYRSLGQALASVPGFFISDDRGYKYVGVRGVGLPSDYNSRVLFLLNGLPLNDKYYDGFYIELTPDLLDAVDRIEVVKGPASALYGSSALFGIVNIITRKGADVNGTMISGAADSNPSGRGVFTYGNQFPNGLDVMLSGHYEENKGQENIDFGQFGKAHDADGRHLADAFLSAQYQDWFVQLWYADRKKTIPTGQFGTIVGDDRTTTEDSWYLAEVRWQHELSDNKTLMLRAYYEDYPYRGTYAYADPVQTLGTETTLDRWLGYEAQFNWQPIEKHRLTLGALYEYHWTDLKGHYVDDTGAVSFVYPGTQDDFSYYAFYAQDEFHFLPPLTLTVGGRYDAYPEDSQSRFTPRAALVWKATGQTTVKLLYGQAFRTPSQYESTYPAGSGTGVANPNIKPEQITTYELVAEQDFRHGLFGRLSVFHNEVTDLIAAQVQNLTQNIFENAFSVRTTGVEAELNKRFANGVRGFVNGTWQHSDFSAGPAINSPEWIANLGVITPIIGEKLSASLRENFVSDRPTRVAGLDAEDAFITTVTLRSENALPHWTFLLSVENLFDQHYGVPSSADGTVDVIPQAGRVIWFRATYKF